jgi:hypothetical protein
VANANCFPVLQYEATESDVTCCMLAFIVYRPSCFGSHSTVEITVKFQLTNRHRFHNRFWVSSVYFSPAKSYGSVSYGMFEYSKRNALEADVDVANAMVLFRYCISACMTHITFLEGHLM